jgi:DNA-directed RNA polymerase specialized sigma24 family protein
MEGLMIGSIPMGSVCIGLTEYRELLESKTRAKSLEKETEAAYNRGYAEGKTAAYEDYLGVLVAKKKTPAHRRAPDKPEAKEDPSHANLAETIAALTTDREKTKVCQDRLKGKSAADIAEAYGLEISTVRKILDAAPKQVKGQWIRR